MKLIVGWLREIHDRNAKSNIMIGKPLKTAAIKSYYADLGNLYHYVD